MERGLTDSTKTWKLVNHQSMSWAPFKDIVSHMCHAGAMVASWSLTQEVASLKVFRCL